MVSQDRTTSWLCVKRVLLIGILLSLIAGAFGFVFARQIGEAAYARVSAGAVGRDLPSELGDGLHVFVCGSGSPMPDPGRAGPCLGVLAGTRAYVFDVGSGSARRLGRMGFPVGKLDGVFLTHLHSDHFDGLGELLLQDWVGASRARPLPIAGPVGTAEVVGGLNAAYRIDSTYRTAHHGAAIANPAGYGGAPQEIVAPAHGPLRLVDGPDLKIAVFLVDHSPVSPAFGYRVDYKGRSLVVSGDTAYSENLVAVAGGADLLFHEALQPTLVASMRDAAAAHGRPNLAKILSDIPGYHATPGDAARAAAAARARMLVLYHLVPPLPTPLLYPAFLGDASSHFGGRIVVGEDGQVFSLPSSSAEIRRRSLR